MKDKILVVGEQCMDIFHYGSVTRLCPEGPVPVFVKTTSVMCSGMARNVHDNLVALGAKIGSTAFQHGQITKTRYIEQSKNHLLLRVDDDSHVEPLKPAYVEEIAESAKKYGTVVISDYNKGWLTEEAIAHICGAAELSFLDTKKPLGSWACASFIKINESEYKISKEADSWRHYLDNRVIVTLGSKGARFRDKVHGTDNVQVADVSGAGDTFLAGLVVEYMRNKDINLAIAYANLCAGQVVQKRGVVVVDPALIKWPR